MFFYITIFSIVNWTFAFAWPWWETSLMSFHKARESPREQRAPSSSHSRALTCGLPPAASNWPQRIWGGLVCADGAAVSHNLQWGSCHGETKWGTPIITASYSTTHLFASSAGLETNCCCDQPSVSDNGVTQSDQTRLNIVHRNHTILRETTFKCISLSKKTRLFGEVLCKPRITSNTMFIMCISVKTTTKQKQ